MLMCGIIDELEAPSSERPFLLSYFFCQATNSGLNSYTAVLRGLIYMLITQQPSLLSYVENKHEHIAAHWNSRVAMEEIFRNMLADPALPETYLVVDALDECLDDLPFLLEMISSMCSGTCSSIRWIVSSRNRCEIKEHLSDQQSKVAISLELNAASVSQAVEHFISYRTGRLAEKKSLQKDVAEQVRHHLSQNSEGTFLWVSLACQRLEKCRSWEISNEILQFPVGLTNLYERMLAQIRASFSSDIYIRLLATVSTVFRPLTFTELIAMIELKLDEKMLPDVIAECGSFLTAKENTVFFIHQSAKDYLLDQSSPILFKSGLAQHHCALFQRSVVMLQVLHKDLYSLVRIGVTVKEAIRQRPEPDPLRSLTYACTFWADHLQSACELKQYGDSIQENPLIKLAIDLIAESPQKSIIRDKFKHCIPELFAKLPEVDQHWNAVQAAYHHPGASDFTTTRFLSDYQLLVSTSDEGEITIWHVEDGTTHQKTQVYNVDYTAVSSDIKWLACITWEPLNRLEPRALQLRDFSSHEVLWTRKVSGREVYGMEFSPDNRWLAVYYGAELELYDLDLMKLVVSPIEPSFATDFEWKEDTGYAVIFSSDSALVSPAPYSAFDIRTGN
ncbi:hypothetical protein ACHAP5_012058 [Fusarium lateritium]